MSEAEPIELKNLDEKTWEDLKKKANIPNSNIFQLLRGEAANVGNAIKEYQKSRADWAAQKAKDKPRKEKGEKLEDISKTADKLRAYVKALDKLQKAFEKFQQVKEFKTPAAQLLKEAIADRWVPAVNKRLVKLAPILKGLEQKNTNDLLTLLDEQLNM